MARLGFLGHRSFVVKSAWRQGNAGRDRWENVACCQGCDQGFESFRPLQISTKEIRTLW
jgi:hypothetical protein